MTGKEINLTINLQFFHNKLVSYLDSHLIALQSTIRSIQDDSFNSSKMKNIGVMQMSMLIPTPEILKQQEINKCFKACVSSLQDFMDNLIGIINMCKSDIRPDKVLTGREEVEKFLQKTQDKFIQDIARDKNLKVRNKLDMLKVDNPTIRKMLDGYFSIRNSIEHHKNITDRDVELIYREFKFLAGDIEIKTLPFRAPENTGITMRAEDVTRTIRKNSLIEISEIEIENIIQTIKILIAVYMTEEASKVKNKSV